MDQMPSLRGGTLSSLRTPARCTTINCERLRLGRGSARATPGQWPGGNHRRVLDQSVLKPRRATLLLPEDNHHRHLFWNLTVRRVRQEAKLVPAAAADVVMTQRARVVDAEAVLVLPGAAQALPVLHVRALRPADRLACC